MGGLSPADRVSVVVPTFDRRSLLGRALDSVAAQTAPPGQTIVVDDGSTDDTAAMLALEYPDVLCIRQPHRGVSAARNAGIEAASGEWVAFLDSDDLWEPTKLERQLAALAAQPEHRLCHTDEIWIRNGRRVNPKAKHAKRGGHIYSHCLPLCCISPSSAIVQRRLLIELGSFDESLPACEDYDLWLRICCRLPVLFLDEPLVIKHGGHDDQLSQLHFGMDRFRIRALEKILKSGELDPQQITETTAVLEDKIRVYANGARKRGKVGEARRYEAKLPTAPRASGAVNIVVALPCEARPLIRRYGLEATGAPFREHRNADDTVRLVVSGVGRENATAATEHLAAGVTGGAWLNVGVAGHRDAPIGTALLAHRIVDEMNGTARYPPLSFSPPCATATVRSVPEPLAEFPDGDLYEMEAAAFFSAARQGASHELIQVLKIVSDNASTPHAELTAAGIEAIIDDNGAVVDELIALLAALDAAQRQLQAPPAGYAELVGRVRFSATQRRQLERLLRRWHLLIPDRDPAREATGQVQRLQGRQVARRVLDTLAAGVESAARGDAKS